MTVGTGTAHPQPLVMADQDHVRAHNLRAVAQFVREHGEALRRDIGPALRLNKATVSSLVGELIARDFLEDAGRQPGQGPGRPSTIVRVDREAHASIVVEILADSVNIGAWTLSLDRLLERSLPLRPAEQGPRATLFRLADAIVGTVSRLRASGRRILGVMIAVPGLLDVRKGTILASTPLGWGHVDLRAAFARQPGLADLHIEIGRIASLATIAESRRQPDQHDLVCLHGGETGIGAGAVVGGLLLTGSRGRAGELLFADLAPTAGGASERPSDLGLSALLRRAAVRPLVLDALLPRLDAGDPRATGAVDALADALARRLATIVALLDPSAIVLAGYLAPLGAHLRTPLCAALRAHLAPRTSDDVEITFGAYGPEAAQIGGSALLADRAFHLIRPARRAPAPITW